MDDQGTGHGAATPTRSRRLGRTRQRPRPAQAVLESGQLALPVPQRPRRRGALRRNPLPPLPPRPPPRPLLRPAAVALPPHPARRRTPRPVPAAVLGRQPPP